MTEPVVISQAPTYHTRYLAILDNQSISRALTRRTVTIQECSLCGAYVSSPHEHTRWHERLAQLVLGTH